MKQQITIRYPPDFDGEFHIDFIEKFNGSQKYYHYQFKHAAKSENEWQTLVKAANAIIAQEKRMNP